MFFSLFLYYFFQGVFGNGKFDTLEDLIKVVSGTIFLGSVAHAAANFCQYDEYAFPANYPAMLNGKPPSNKVLKVQIAYYTQIQKKFLRYHQSLP